MVSFLVEAYLSGAHANRLDEIASRLRLAAEEVSRSGTPVSFLRYTYLPADELCPLVFESGSSEVVDAAVERAGRDSLRADHASAGSPDRLASGAGLTALLGKPA